VSGEGHGAAGERGPSCRAHRQHSCIWAHSWRARRPEEGGSHSWCLARQGARLVPGLGPGQPHEPSGVEQYMVHFKRLRKLQSIFEG